MQYNVHTYIILYDYFINIILLCKLLALQPERERQVKNKKCNKPPKPVAYALTWSFSHASCKPLIQQQCFVSNPMVYMLIGYSQQGAARYSTQVKPQICLWIALWPNDRQWTINNEHAILVRNALLSQNIERPHTGVWGVCLLEATSCCTTNTNV